MEWYENVLILAGISLDVFAAMECRGSLVAKIDKMQLAMIGCLVTAVQVISLALGHFLSVLLYCNELSHDEKFIGQVMAAVIFFGVGSRLVIKAVKNERIHERREDVMEMKQMIRMMITISMYSLLAGLAFGFLGANVPLIVVTAAALTVSAVVMGMYTGYHFGFEHKTKAYIGGAIFLWIEGIEVIVLHTL